MARSFKLDHWSQYYMHFQEALIFLDTMSARLYISSIILLAPFPYKYCIYVCNVQNLNQSTVTMF